MCGYRAPSSSVDHHRMLSEVPRFGDVACALVLARSVMNPRTPLLWNTLGYLEANRITLSELLLAALEYNQPHRALYHDLRKNVEPILSALYGHSGTADATSKWAHELMKTRYREAARELTDVVHGWHFGAAQAHPEQIQGFQIEDMARRMRAIAPELWELVGELLGGFGLGGDGAGIPMDAEEAIYWDDSEDVSAAGTIRLVVRRS